MGGLGLGLGLGRGGLGRGGCGRGTVTHKKRTNKDEKVCLFVVKCIALAHALPWIKELFYSCKQGKS